MAGGKRNKQQRKIIPQVEDSDDESSVSSSSTAISDLTSAPEPEELISGDKSMAKNLDDLYEKRGSTRENALSLLIDGFASKLQHQFVENTCITLLNQCHSSIKRGSAKEINLSSRVIGYLAVTVGGCENSTAAHEILEESIAPLSQGLKSGSEISSVLECLAIITFVGGNNSEDTERSMQSLWPFVNPKLGSNVVVASKPNPTILRAAISAWTFLLTTMDRLDINSKAWQDSISYFSSLLDKDDRAVRIAAGEALAVIFEVGNLDKFAKGSGSIHLQGLKGKVVEQVRNLSAEGGGKGLAKKDLSSQRDMFREILEFLVKDDYSPETTIKIGADVLRISSWCQLIQMNFLKHFLGSGFMKHMQENVLLHEVFNFKPKRKKITAGSELHFAGTEKRMYKSPNSAMNKARTQSLNEKRMKSQGRKTGHYAVSAGDEEA